MDFEKELNKDYDRTFYSELAPEPEGLPAEMQPGTQSVTPAEFAMEGANFVKGIATGAVGLAGDVVSIGRGLYEIGVRGGDTTKLDAFLEGMGKGTILPTSEDINKWVDANVPLPEGMKSGSVPGMIGEIVAPGGLATKVAKTAAKGGKVAGKALAKEASVIATGAGSATISREQKAE